MKGPYLRALLKLQRDEIFFEYPARGPIRLDEIGPLGSPRQGFDAERSGSCEQVHHPQPQERLECQEHGLADAV
jgi:hypothetical protein